MTSAKNNSAHLLLGPIVALTCYTLLSLNGVTHQAAATAAITLLTAWYWATEALPIAATSLIPFTLFPISGVLDHKAAASGLGSHIILLMLGGFISAKALEHTGAHKRFAITIISAVGTHSSKRIIAAFMLTAACLSMWISNTATCLMLMPIALACAKQLEQEELTAPLILAVAYACSIGGMATLIGTPPNVIFAGVYEQVSGQEFGFLNWMSIGLPITLLALPTCWLWLSRNLGSSPGSNSKTGSIKLTPKEIVLPSKAAWSTDQKRVIYVFSLMIFLWVFRTQPFGGWSGLGNFTHVGDSSIAMLGAALMFIVRSKNGGGLLNWKTANDIPWGILLMFAAGITIAKAFFASGLAELIGSGLSDIISVLPIYLVILLICVSITFFTEVNSNLATSTLVLPILAAAANTSNISLELLMVPATISASCAFMLPVATAPNAIAYATGKVSIKKMMREGLYLNLILTVLVSLACFLMLS